MKAIIIYDDAGHIISQVTGNGYKPVGIPFLEVEVPESKYVKAIDVSNEDDHTPIYEEFPKSEVAKITDKLELLQSALDDLILGGAL